MTIFVAFIGWRFFDIIAAWLGKNEEAEGGIGIFCEGFELNFVIFSLKNFRCQWWIGLRWIIFFNQKNQRSLVRNSLWKIFIFWILKLRVSAYFYIECYFRFPIKFSRIYPNHMPH
jgi:hypothetical protein